MKPEKKRKKLRENKLNFPLFLFVWSVTVLSKYNLNFALLTPALSAEHRSTFKLSIKSLTLIFFY